MTGKDIVLRINAITNKDEVEALGKVLDDVLGSYDDNVQLLAQYNQQLNETSANIKALNKAQQEQGGLSAKQQARYAELIKQERELKQGKSELQIVMKNQEKIMQSENGSMKQQSLILGQLRMLYRNLTDEQKAALPQLKTAIDGLDSSLKKADADIGNFQRNVGNYPQLMQQILPVQGQVGNGLMQIAQSMGATTGALGVLGGALAVGAAAWGGFQQAMELTQTVGDAVAIKVGGWSAAWDKFVRMVVSWDFSNFIQNLKDAKQAGEELTAELDELFERNNALKIAQAEASIEQEKNLMIMRDQTKSAKERKEAGQAYMESVRELAKVEQDIAKQEFDARLKNFAAQTGLSEEDVQFYIKNYNKYREVKEATSEDEKRFIQISEKYNNANDEITSQLVDAWVRVSTTISNGEKSIQRAATTVNSLTAQQDKQKQKTARPQSQEEIFKQYTYDINKEMHQQVVSAMDDIAVAMEEEVPKLVQVAMPVVVPELDNRSPFAKFLGISEEQLTTIKSQALQAAQQIYGSIQQIAQDATQRRLEDELKAVEDEAESEKAILKGKLDKNLITQAQYEKKLEKIDADAEAKREELNKEAFEKNKRWNIAQALMNGALALTKLFTEATVLNPATWIAAGITTSTTAAQIAAIASQKYARGGELHGASHAQGGIKGNVQGHNIELEGDEVVINKRSSRKYRSLLSYINSDNGWGVDFAGVRGRGGYRPQLRYARGGVLGSYDFSPAAVPHSNTVQQSIARQAERTEELIAATNRRIDRLQVQVNISDIEGASDTKQVHINRASLP